MASFEPNAGRPSATGKYPLCDTFFVEEEETDEGRFVKARKSREEMRLKAERQQIMADEMSRATCEEYQEEVLDHMECMEV